MRITTKGQMYELLMSGALGNTVRMWRTPEEASADGWTGTVGIRAGASAGPGRGHRLHVPLRRVWEVAREMGLSREQVLLNEDPPYDIRNLNAEAMLTPAGLYLRYNAERGALMRDAMSRPSHAFGLRAAAVMAAHMSPGDYDRAMDVLESYDGATGDVSAALEFSCFDVCVGWAPHSNTVIWEVRSY